MPAKTIVPRCIAQLLAPRRKSVRDALDRARARGEARRAPDTESLLDLLAGRSISAHCLDTGA